ncbi:MAG: HAMP domain-containing histidine kinase [Anaerolineales bacterium]|nr:HAMP domain-containing histidine kinase [Anaerolineales bacterium]MCX7608352.1 HAMP domain-containing histidine kinase [Anaerolineales bacterium]MDW8226417.1 ATP-binding protein [Anaerolineales bacterium]
MTTPLSPEILVPRLGESLVQNGIITEEDLQRALAYQHQQRQQGQHCFLGQALVELGLIDRQQLDHAVTMQILQLRNALEDANRFLERRVQERTAELQEALRKLSELNQLKANFVSNISHELRTPLTHIKGYLELLASGALGELNEEQKHAVQVSQRSASQLESLIDSLILFSQAARGEMALKLKPVNLARVAAEVINYSRVKANNRNITLEYDIPTDLPLVQADEEKLSWVLLQLLDNAIKFTPAGGQVKLSMQVEADRLVMISVKDTGIGIPAHRIQEIFEPFHQLDGSSTRKYRGTGLGLALVQEIIHAHGSILEVESTEGVGSEFRFPLVVTNIVA